eukprot:114326_1
MESNNHLVFLDISIAPKEFKQGPLNLLFHLKNMYNAQRMGRATISSNISKDDRGQSHCEDAFDSNMDIVEHLYSHIVDWETYKYCRLIANSLRRKNTLHVPKESYRILWNQHLKLIRNEPNLANAHRLQLVKSIDTKQLENISCQDLFYITRACVVDDLAFDMDNPKTAGISLYNSFVNDARFIFDYLPFEEISLEDRLFMVPVFNYFSYLRTLKQ